MSKPLCSMAAAKLYGASIGLPDSEIDKFYDHFEANGWKVGRVAMRSWEAAMRNWKRTWEERAQAARDRLQTRSLAPAPLWKQIEILEMAVNCHEANPNSLTYDSRTLTDAKRLDLKEKRAKLAKLKEQQLATI